MAQVPKIDGNVTGLRYAEEASYKTLPGSPIWVPLDPNSYADFGGNVTLLARNPINDSRQRKKGVITDLDASGGFNIDLTQTNVQALMQGFLFATFRPKGEEIVTAVDIDAANPDEYEVASTTGFQVNDLIEGQNFTNAGNNTVNVVTVVTADTSVEVATGTLTAEASPPSDAQIVVVGHQFASATADVDVSNPFPRITRASGSVDWTTFGINPGEFIYIGGDNANESFVNAANNGFKRVRQVAATFIELDKSDSTMVTETGTGLTVRMWLGRFLKNELSSLIVRRTYNLERTLGAPDDGSPSQIQSEYIIGAVPNELTINVAQADKITMDVSFVGADHETRTGATGVKTGTRPALVDTDAFNTSSDFSRIRLATIDATTEAPTPLFAFVTDMTLSINNNVSPNKAISVLGAFEVTAGTFQVGGSLTAYFGNVSAISAVRSNSDVTLDFVVVKSNAGIAVDVPLMALGDSRANVTQDEAITLPISMDAATASKIDSTLDHTLSMVFFDHLPTVAAG